MAARVGLDRLQRWMQAVVVHPGTVEEAILSKTAEREVKAKALEGVVLPSRTMTPLARIGVYHGMYLLRMHDALVSDYEALRHFLGDDAFLELVRSYVKVHPSRSASLNRLGDRLPDFIKTLPGLRRRAFCSDLARLECVLAQVFDAPETPSLAAESIALVEPEAWEKARLRPIAALRLVSLRYPANAYLQSVREGNHGHPRPRRKDEWIAVYRKDYAVRRLSLDRAGYALLQDLTEGVTLGNAVAKALKRGGRRPPGEGDVFAWFREWVAGGLFQAIETGRERAVAPRKPALERRTAGVRK